MALAPASSTAATTSSSRRQPASDPIAERTSAIWDGSKWNVWGPGEVVVVLTDDVKTYQSGESFL